MRPGKIEIVLELEKQEAINFYLAEKGTTLNAEIEMLIKDLYEKTVPTQVRSFIEKRPVPEVTKRGRKKVEPKTQITESDAEIKESGGDVS